MENLIINKNKRLHTNNFVRIGDLSYFEGPLLSVFEELNSGHLYLFDWVDRDHNFNRWLIYRISPKFLLQYINCEITHFELFERRPDKDIYFTDIDLKNQPFSDYESFALELLPQNYFPNTDNFFELCDCKHFEKIKSAIINSLSNQKSENEYSVVDSEQDLKSKNVKSSYFNRIQNNLHSIAISTQYIGYGDIQMLGKLQINNIQGISFKSYTSVKKRRFQNKKQYANQYN